MRLLLALPLLAALATHAAPNIQQDVPHGRAPLVDNHTSVEEWAGASRVELPGGAQLLLLQNDEYIFLCVKAPKPSVFGVDLYISDAAGRVMDLQASSYLGERTSDSGKWPEWTWWNNDGWTATIVPYLLKKDGHPEFLTTTAKEFQLSKRRFSGMNYRIRLTYQFGANSPAYSFPVGSNELDPAIWYPLNL